MDNLKPEIRSKIMSSIQGRNTRPELLIRSTLHRLGFRFRIHRKDLPGNPDIVFPARRKAVFVDGCFWHGHECRYGHLPTSNVRYWKKKIHNNRLRDERVRNLLRLGGWRVLAIWECEIQNRASLIKKLNRFLTRPSDNHV
jgi:DNA mismatch endonuclease (patch repair protein)